MRNNKTAELIRTHTICNKFILFVIALFAHRLFLILSLKSEYKISHVSFYVREKGDGWRKQISKQLHFDTRPREPSASRACLFSLNHVVERRADSEKTPSPPTPA